MARMTVRQAADKARDLAAALRRLDTLQHAEVTGTGRRHELAAERRNRSGRRHELDTALRLVDELRNGLAGPGPMRDGQIGGQRQGGHATSAEALRLVAPKVGTQRQRVLDAVAAFVRDPYPYTEPGATDVDLQVETSLPANSVRPRRVELVDGGWVMDSGKRRKHRGREHVVWTLTPEARDTIDKQASHADQEDHP